MSIDPSILANVDPKWHVDFVRFVQTGEADPLFLDLLDEDKALQQVVERAIFADEVDIRERIATDDLLCDVKLAVAALEESMKIAKSRVVNVAIGIALRASRFALDVLKNSGDS